MILTALALIKGPGNWPLTTVPLSASQSMLHNEILALRNSRLLEPIGADLSVGDGEGLGDSGSESSSAKESNRGERKGRKHVRERKGRGNH